MRIAVATYEKSLDSIVPEKFDEAQYLLIIDIDLMKIEHIVAADEAEVPSVHFAEKILEWDCEAVLCGEIDEVPFDIIADGNVTRFAAAGCTVLSAIDAMNRDKLDYIRNFAGGGDCQGKHRH